MMKQRRHVEFVGVMNLHPHPRKIKGLGWRHRVAWWLRHVADHVDRYVTPFVFKVQGQVPVVRSFEDYRRLVHGAVRGLDAELDGLIEEVQADNKVEVMNRMGAFRGGEALDNRRGKESK